MVHLETLKETHILRKTSCMSSKSVIIQNLLSSCLLNCFQANQTQFQRHNDLPTTFNYFRNRSLNMNEPWIKAAVVDSK